MGHAIEGHWDLPSCHRDIRTDGQISLKISVAVNIDIVIINQFENFDQ